MKRNVLLIAGKRSINAEAMVRYWPNDKWDLHLYTYRKKEWYTGMSEQLGEKWIAFSPSPSKNNTADGSIGSGKKQPKFRDYIKSKKKSVQKYVHMRLLRLYDQQLLKWALPASSDTKSILEKTNPDLIISVFEPLAANLIARRIALSRGIPWIAYFRDHCTTYNEIRPVPILWQLQAAYDRRLHSPLNCLVGVSPQFVDILSSFYEIPRSRSHVVTGVFDDCYLPEDIKKVSTKRRRKELLTTGKDNLQPTPLKVSYVGNLYGHRVEPLCIFMNALQVMADKGVPCELTLWLSNAHYIFPKKVKEMIAQLRSKGLTVIFGSTRVPYTQALEMINLADVSVIVEGIRAPHSKAGTLTAKIFDLMMIAKPAIAVCSPSLPIGDYLRETGIGIDAKDVEGTVAALTEIWKWKQGGSIPSWYSPVASAIEEYSSRSMAAKMSELSEQVCNRSLTAS